MQISVIILNYNVRYFLEQCLLSVQKALVGIPSEIIVVDNDSSDDSCAMVRSLFPDVKLIANTTNTGFPKGNNIGVDKASGKYLCILNPDTLVAEDTFVQLLAFAESKADIGIIGCQLIDGRGEFLPESKRHVPTPLVSLKKLLGFPQRYYAGEITVDQIGKVPVFVGAFMFCWRERYLELGGFDEDFFMYGEDVDLSYRFLKKGYTNYYYGLTSILHYKGESTLKDKVYLQRFYGAMEIFYKKHFKTNFLLTMGTKLGVNLLKIYNQIRPKSVKQVHYDKVLFISQSQQKQQRLQKLFSQMVHLITDAIPELEHNARYLIIFDGDFLDNVQIIEQMQRIKGVNRYFKIWVSGRDFLIGSNSREDKGGVMIIE